MPTTAAIATFLLGSAIFVLVPGPSVLFILGRAIALGRRAALATAAGLLFCVLASGVDALWALMARTARDWFASSPTRLRRMGGAGGLIMIGMGIGVAATGRQD